MTKTIKNLNPKTVDRNIKAIMGYMADMGYCTQTTMGDKLGMSSSMAGVYLNEAVERKLLVLGPKKRPKQYALPKNADKPEPPDKSIFEKQGTNASLSIYVDESICNKIKALSIMRQGSMYGGQGQLITTLIEEEFAKISPTYHGDLAKLVVGVEGVEELKGSIPIPVEWT